MMDWELRIDNHTNNYIYMIDELVLFAACFWWRGQDIDGGRMTGYFLFGRRRGCSISISFLLYQYNSLIFDPSTILPPSFQFNNRSTASSVVHPPSTLVVSTTSTVTATRLALSFSFTMVTCVMLPILLPSLPTSSLMRFTTWVPWVTLRFHLICLRWVWLRIDHTCAPCICAQYTYTKQYFTDIYIPLLLFSY